MDMVNLSSDTFLTFYSLITCHNVLGYISNPTDQLHKMYSWLKPGGLLSIVVRTPSGRFAEVYERSESINLAIKRYKHMKMYGSFGDVFDFYTPSSLISMIEVDGFSILKSQGLYSLEKYLPKGNEILRSTLPELKNDNYFFIGYCVKKKIIQGLIKS
jgi:SAM-dependent methyltransferase